MTDEPSRHVAVIGGGVAGLVAARSLARAGMAVTVLEATAMLGGQVRTVDFAGHRVEVGAEALHLGAPAMSALLAELGLDRRVEAARPGSAWLWSGGALRRLPAGVGPSGPTRLGPVLGARVLSPRGIARAALEPLIPRTSIDPDLGVGVYLARRFGPQVRDRLVDPVLGALHAGDVDHLSLAAAAPHLAAVATRHRSLLLAHRARRNGPAPSFGSLPEGLDTLVQALAGEQGISIVRSTPVASISATSTGYEVNLVAGAPLAVAGIVLAAPASVARTLLADLVPAAAVPLGALHTVSVATVLVAYPRDAIEGLRAFDGTGLLVTSAAGRHLKAATFLSRKWGHLDGDLFLVRLSAGRTGGPDVAAISDDDLIQRLHADLAAATGLHAVPVASHVERWPHTMAQLEVGHVDRMGAIRAALVDHPGLVVAGAPYDGVGLTACVASGQRAAATVSEYLVQREAVFR